MHRSATGIKRLQDAWPSSAGSNTRVRLAGGNPSGEREDVRPKGLGTRSQEADETQQSVFAFFAVWSSLAPLSCLIGGFRNLSRPPGVNCIGANEAEENLELRLTSRLGAFCRHKNKTTTKKKTEKKKNKKIKTQKKTCANNHVQKQGCAWADSNLDGDTSACCSRSKKRKRASFTFTVKTTSY